MTGPWEAARHQAEADDALADVLRIAELYASPHPEIVALLSAYAIVRRAGTSAAGEAHVIALDVLAACRPIAERYPLLRAQIVAYDRAIAARDDALFGRRGDY